MAASAIKRPLDVPDARLVHPTLSCPTPKESNVEFDMVRLTRENQPGYGFSPSGVRPLTLRVQDGRQPLALQTRQIHHRTHIFFIHYSQRRKFWVHMIIWVSFAICFHRHRLCFGSNSRQIHNL